MALDAGEIGPPPTTAYAVTPALREWYAEGDLEELEYAATLAAARASLRLLADDASVPRRRVVIAADVDDGAVRPVPDVERSAVLVTGSIPMTVVASAHVDDEGVVDAIAPAADVVRQADAGDEDASFTVDEAQAQELQWFATQELRDLTD
ncbi:MAG: DUF6912 family protein [Actinomycetes bacterium]